jgi:hypothetical protein
LPPATAAIELYCQSPYRDDRLEGFCTTNLCWTRLHTGDVDGARAASELSQSNPDIHQPSAAFLNASAAALAASGS